MYFIGNEFVALHGNTNELDSMDCSFLYYLGRIHIYLGSLWFISRALFYNGAILICKLKGIYYFKNSNNASYR